MEKIKKKPLKLKEGDIFTIPMDEETQGFGQIIKIPRKYVFIMIVFEGRWNIKESVSIDQIIKNHILFLGYSQDALLFNGRWIIIGNATSNLSSITFPFYKLGISSETKLVNYKLDVLRQATPEEDKLLPFQSNRSPIGYQNALQAYYGIIDYEQDLKYHYDYMVSVYSKLKLLSN